MKNIIRGFMKETILEVGMLLDKNFSFYNKMLKNNGLKQVFKCTTHDIYFTKEKSFDGLSENQIKNSCIRIRNPKKCDKDKIANLLKDGYHKVFDTIKKDYHYQNSTMKSRVQLQKIKNIGLVVYYDNPDYYNLPEEEQRLSLLKELNSYGFSFSEQDLGIDKLRSLYYNKKLYSKNQNA